MNFPRNLAHFKNSIVKSRIFSRELGWSLSLTPKFTYYWTAGLLAILAKSIAIAIAILGGNSIAILSAILYFKSVLQLQYFFQYGTPSRLCTHSTWHWQSLSTVLLHYYYCIIILLYYKCDALTLSFLHLHNTKQSMLTV